MPVDLYALPPEEFTAARDAAAKSDKTLRALRKPTVSAWVVNTLVRREAGLLDDLLALGAELGQAQSDRDPAALRRLTEQRRQLVAAVTQRAVDLVDRDVTATARAEVEATLDAALADPASAEAVRTGQLLRALSYAGFGGVDLDGAVAPLAPQKTPTLEAAALDAAGRLDDAVQRAQKAARDVETGKTVLSRAESDEQAATEAVAAAKQALESAEAKAKDAHRQWITATKDRDEVLRKAKVATEAVRDAQEASDAARTALDTARRG